ncbi:SRPBCC family protein [Paractinoplanes rishiriensis]|uniref:Polyketide cyclase n=1 Tax=Paractinoplanes rishiriensis TaxID=1050105 RepID=A0A919JVW3_9ACTN|nr:SRPBCC family protein [Actinoplanes rishiriensis]GIE94555.1 polyketide cyclase [Actinoplanes rishiriensis]
MGSDSGHVSERIARDAGEVYAYVADLAHIPQWAPGLGDAVERAGDDWFVTGALGRVRVVLAPVNDFGVLDHYVTVESGQEFLNPVRVVPYGTGCEITFTVRRAEGATDAEFARDAAAVAADLARLREILEKRGG